MRIFRSKRFLFILLLLIASSTGVALAPSNTLRTMITIITFLLAVLVQLHATIGTNQDLRQLAQQTSKHNRTLEKKLELQCASTGESGGTNNADLPAMLDVLIAPVANDALLAKRASARSEKAIEAFLASYSSHQTSGQTEPHMASEHQSIEFELRELNGLLRSHLHAHADLIKSTKPLSSIETESWSEEYSEHIAGDMQEFNASNITRDMDLPSVLILNGRSREAEIALTAGSYWLVRRSSVDRDRQLYVHASLMSS